MTIFGTGDTFHAMTTPNKRDTMRYLQALRMSGRSDFAIAEALGLCSLDTFRKWEVGKAVPVPSRFAKLKEMAEKARGEK